MATPRHARKPAATQVELDVFLGAAEHAVGRLDHLCASRAVELSQLLGKATSLGGLRPKFSILNEDGAPALGKFPGVQKERSATLGEAFAPAFEHAELARARQARN